MDLTNAKIEDMINKKINAKLYVKWYRELSEKNQTKMYVNVAERLDECLNFTTWDKYNENKVLDLKTINRCKNKFCPNCRKFYASKALNNMEKPNEYLKALGHNSYLLTITVPNIELDISNPNHAAVELNNFIKKMNESFTRFNRKLSHKNNSKFERMFSIYAGVKSLEITWKVIDKEKLIYSFHPHFHCIIYSKDIPPLKLKKNIQGPYQNRTKKYIKFSQLDFYIMKMWTLSFNQGKMTKNTLRNMPDTWYNDKLQEPNYYMCDIRPIQKTHNGEFEDFIEVFKYPFKDLTIDNIKLFELLVIGIKNLRFTQTFGALHNLDIEYDDMGKIQELLLEIEENPAPVNVQGLNALVTEYKEFKKISRFNAHKNLNKI